VKDSTSAKARDFSSLLFVYGLCVCLSSLCRPSLSLLSLSQPNTQKQKKNKNNTTKKKKNKHKSNTHTKNKKQKLKMTAPWRHWWGLSSQH